MKHIVMMAEIAVSRHPKEVQNLQEYLDTLNKGHSYLLSPYTITRKNEFQAIFHHADSIFSDTLEILSFLYPLKAKFSIGIGTMETPFNRSQTIGMDGQAFHLARKGIEGLKKKSTLYALETESESWAQPVLDLLSLEIKSWNQNRFEICKMLLSRTPVQTMKEHLNISDKAIYKSIQSGGLTAIVKIMEHLTRLINNSMAEL